MSKKNVLITGLPGVGKTTLVKKIAQKLLSQTQCGINNYNVVNGFYTEEVRENSYRLGFDIVTLTENKREILARKNSSTNDAQFQVGPYKVLVENIEKIAVPLLENPKEKVLIIDEIGKMELLSRKFENAVKKVIEDKDITVIATVPLKGGGPFVNRIKSDKTNVMFTVTQANRNQLLDDILSQICI